MLIHNPSESRESLQHAPNVSVVIPVYNRAQMLKVAVASALEQNVPPDEIIIVDDGSTDGTASCAAALIKLNPTVRLIKQKNAGANIARNTGIQAARGTWIAFLDSDDRWEPTKIARQLAALSDKPNAIASFTGIAGVDGKRHLYNHNTPSDISLSELRRQNTLGTTSTSLIRRDVLIRVGCFDPTLPSCQDWDLWLRLRREGEFAIVRESLTYYEVGPHDRITNALPKALAGHQRVFSRALSDVTDQRERRLIQASHLVVISRVLQQHGAWRKAAWCAAHSFALRPTRAAFRAFHRSLRGWQFP